MDVKLYSFHNDGTLPIAVTMDELMKNNCNLSIYDVEKLIVDNDGINGRLDFFETFARNNTFYLKVAQPLLSMRTTGSIDVEHRIKPLEHNTMTKKRNTSKDPNGIALLRGQENLKHLMRAKLDLGKKITDSHKSLVYSNK